MSEHIQRKDLKRDAVRDTLIDTGRTIAAHERFVAWLIGIAVLIGLGYFGWMTYSDKQTAKADAIFSDALQTFTSADQPQPGQVTPIPEFAYTQAEAKFREAALTYPHTRPGQLSHYYAAMSLEKLGKNEDARRWLEGMAQLHNKDFSAMAKFAIAQLDETEGKGEDAARIYQQLIDNPSVLTPKPVVMLALADYYSKSKPAEAIKLYNDIKAQYPNTSASRQADQALGILGAKS